ncbi:putative glucooligosaccharide oxidase [Jackrogersella minutella]|nr:putative glucooligosaccharide oxidase [Jackrogersella minutella]
MHSSMTLCLGLMASLAQGGPLNKRAVLEDCLSGTQTAVDEVGSDDYNRDITPFNKRLEFLPAAIAAPTTVEQIKGAVACGSKLGYKVTAKCGGHSYASLGLGGEDGHLIVELDRMNSVKLDTETNIATVDSGTRLGHLASELFAQGNRAISHGTCPGVGISGHVLHGGFGMSSHTRGLALDWVAGMNVLLANGTVIHTSATENKDVFWGLLGAGSNFGVVLNYELNTFEPPANVTWFVVNLPWKQNTSVAGLEALEDYALNTQPAELNMRLYATRQFTQLEGSYHGNKTDLEAALEPLLNKTGGNLAAAQTVTWLKGLEHFATMKLNQTYPYTQVQENFYGKSLELKGLNKTSAQGFVDYWFNVAKNETAHWYIQLDIHGGKNSAVWKADSDLTSYVHRDKLYILQFYITTSGTPEEAFKFVDDWSSATTSPLTASDWGMYFNYPDTNLNRTRAQEMYWGKNLAKLQQLKAELDPNELFYYPVSLSPAQNVELV